MATIKVFDSSGVKVLQCFDTLDNVPYYVEEEDSSESDEVEDDTVGF